MSVLKAIRQKCLDCCCQQRSEVEQCTMTKCALHPYRMGKNPFRQKRVLSEEQKQALRAGLERARQTSSERVE